MSKGLTEALKLKKKLTATKNELCNTLLGRQASNLTLAERKVYQEWLTCVNDIIAICEERKRF